MNLPYSDMLAEIGQVRDDMYNDIFRDLFLRVADLHLRFKSESRPITDTELEVILTELPLQLFTIAERLADIKMRMSVTKLENKHKRVSLTNAYLSDPVYDNLSTTARRDAVGLRVDSELKEDEIAVMVYSSLIDRIEGEMSFSRELIMGAKKVWDARRAALLPTGPTAPSDVELADYVPGSSPPGKPLGPYIQSERQCKDYIKGDVDF